MILTFQIKHSLWFTIIELVLQNEIFSSNFKNIFTAQYFILLTSCFFCIVYIKTVDEKRGTFIFDQQILYTRAHTYLNTYLYTHIVFLCVGEPGSTVFGSITNGVFEGKIVSPKGSYYVEKSKHYFPHNSNQSFHSVIYDENHVEDPYRDRRQGKYYLSESLTL